MSATLENVVEVLLLASGRALKVEEIVELMSESAIEADRAAVRTVLETLGEQWHSRGLELREVASGFRLQVRPEYAPWLSRLWAERPARYSRALLETLALVAYRQPVTRGEIEDVRGVSVSASIVKTLLEREWVRVLGHREVPGRPAIYGTTRTFLDDFNLTGLEDLPPLAEVRDIDRFHGDLFNENSASPTGDEVAPADASDARTEPGEKSASTASELDALVDEAEPVVSVNGIIAMGGAQPEALSAEGAAHASDDVSEPLGVVAAYAAPAPAAASPLADGEGATQTQMDSDLRDARETGPIPSSGRQDDLDDDNTVDGLDDDADQLH
jgi:segregation and condensation protein B